MRAIWWAAWRFRKSTRPTRDPQHNGLDFKHPRGGEALYLQKPLLEHRDKYLEDIARTVLEDGGQKAMISAMEDLAEEGGVATRAPVLYDNLRASGHPSVTSDGEKIYDRAPRQERLTEEQLKAIYREHHPVPSKLTAKQRAYLFGSGILRPAEE